MKTSSTERWRKANAEPAHTVVIVDDDEALLEALRFGLELEGFQVQSHRSAGSVHAETLPATDCCLVIDYKMPGMNGIDLLARLRRQAIVLPAIVITSHARPDILARCRALRATVVEKPLLGDGLLTALREAFNLHTATHDLSSPP